MNPIAPPRLHGTSLGKARFKSRPEDFQVEEVLGWQPSGTGEHCFLWIEKSGWNTNDVAAELARRLQIRKRQISHCGLKDKNAITRQWFSIHLPGIKSPTAEELEINGIRILNITRNSRKLRRGVHRGNRFTIRLRECNFSATELETRWNHIVARGVPNYFGSQRFGRQGSNIDQALQLAVGELEIRDRLVRGILLSALRSFLFNAVVGQRVLDGSWDKPLVGEIYGFADNRSIVLPERQTGNEPERVQNGDLELTAPLWGEGALLSQGAVKKLEHSTATQHKRIADALTSAGLQQQRRVIRLTPISPQLEWEAPQTLLLQFELPKGTYATAIILELIDL